MNIINIFVYITFNISKSPTTECFFFFLSCYKAGRVQECDFNMGDLCIGINFFLSSKQNHHNLSERLNINKHSLDCILQAVILLYFILRLAFLKLKLDFGNCLNDENFQGECKLLYTKNGVLANTYTGLHI